MPPLVLIEYVASLSMVATSSSSCPPEPSSPPSPEPSVGASTSSLLPSPEPSTGAASAAGAVTSVDGVAGLWGEGGEVSAGEDAGLAVLLLADAAAAVESSTITATSAASAPEPSCVSLKK